MKYALVLLSLMLCACASVDGNPAGGMFQNSWPDSNAFNLAEAHCAKYQKHALITGAPYPSVTFACQ